jgi:hypothetical protein
MKDVRFVSVNELETLEQYAGALLSGLVTLRTLEAYHLEAYKKGLLDEDEAELSATLSWEIKRLIGLYKKQIENIVERTKFNPDEALNEFRKMMPDIKIPRKRTKKERINGKATLKSNNVS